MRGARVLCVCQVRAEAQQAVYQGDAGVRERVNQRVGGVQAGRVGLASAAHREATHPARMSGGHSGWRVFDDEAMRGRNVQPFGGGEEDIRRGLAMRHLLAGDDGVEE